MVSAFPQLDITKAELAEDSEEGHPDAREVIFIVDTVRNSKEDTRQVILSALNRFDIQVGNSFFWLLILKDFL